VETNLRRHVLPRLGHRPIAQIRRSEIQALVRSCSDTLAPATVELVYTYTASIFRSAVADRVIATSPCTAIKLPPRHKAPIVPLATETVTALVANVADRYRGLLVIGAGTGVRISEALGLTVDRVDWKRGFVTIDRQLVGIAEGRPVFGPVKDRHNRPRTIPLPEAVLHALVAQVRDYPPGPEGLIFTGQRGEPIRRTTFSDAWRRAADPLGVAKGDGYHQLRHYYASLLIAHGESVKVVQARLGHSTATETHDTYGHLWPDTEDRTRVAVDGVLGLALEASSNENGEHVASISRQSE
jgi:integrase